MMTQKQISKILNCSQTTVNLILTGERPPSWKMADKLSVIFPGKSLKEWKYAKPEELKQAFEQLKREVA